MKEYLLEKKQVDFIAQDAVELMNTMKLDSKQILRFRLSIEEVLLNWIDMLEESEQKHVCMRIGKKMGRSFIELSLKGSRLDPLEFSEDDETQQMSRTILTNMGLAPAFQYIKGVNYVTFAMKKKRMNIMFRMILAILLAVGLGILCQYIPDTIRDHLNDGFLTPVFNGFMNVLNALAGPMMFCSVLWGIYDIGDMASLGKIGKRILLRIVFMTFAIAIVVTLVGLFFYPIKTQGAVFGIAAIEEIFQMIIDIIPGNFIQPFLDGNTLQIIFEAIVVGLAVLVLGKKANVVTTFVSQLNSIVYLIMEVVGDFAPLFVFTSIFQIMLSDMGGVLLQAVKFFVIFFISVILVLVVYGVHICIAKKVSIKTLFKKLSPAFLIAVTTASSSAAFGTCMQTCTKRFGIQEKLCNFALPIGIVLFMPGAVITNVTMSMFLAEHYNVDMTISWLIMMILISSMLAMASAPVPGSGITCYTLLFTQLGIPTAGLGLAVALNILIDFVDTATSVTSLMMEIIVCSDELGMLNKKTLRE